MKPAELLQRNKFFIGVAVLVLVGILAVIGLFLPARAANGETAKDLGAKSQSLATYAAKPELASKASVEEATKLTATYQGALDELRGELAKQAAPLDEPLREKGAPATTGQLDGSTWKLVYAQDVKDLADSLGKSFLVVGANPIVAQSYGDEIPPAPEIATQTRYLLVQKYAIAALAGLNDQPNAPIVPVFNGFSFLSAPERLLSPIHGQDFTPIPFEIRVSANFGNIPRVLFALLKSPVKFELTSISVARPDRLDRVGVDTSNFGRRTQLATAAAPKKPVAVAAAPTPGPGAAAPAPAGPSEEGPNMAALAMMQAQEKERIAQMIAMSQRMAAANPVGPMGMGMPGGPPMGVAPTTTTPAAAVRRPTVGVKIGASEVTEAIKAQLPKTLVDLTIRGYVADYNKKKAS